MARIPWVAALWMFCIASVGAWQWPVDGGVLVTGFAQLHHDGFSRGVLFAGDDAVVRSAAAGEVVFFLAPGHRAHPLGNFVALSHDGGFRSVYTGLEDVELSDGVTSVVAGERLGIVGGSGFARGRRVGFQIIDEELDAFVNPMLILPPREDRRSPVIVSILLERDGQTIAASAVTSYGPPGAARLLVETFDPSAETGTTLVPLAPYEIVVELEGREIRRITFETLQARDGSVVLAGRYRADALYRGERLLDLGEIVVGERPVPLAVTVRDFAGNRVRRTVSLNPTAAADPQAGP
ncbi:MAG: M23 family metallopeptidase [Spirochaetaceae bacterium]|nr:MAG: M23 family metallopeptidase [Spirochaetaceae bacterium]